MICAAPGLRQRIEHLPYSAAARLASFDQMVPHDDRSCEWAETKPHSKAD